MAMLALGSFVFGLSTTAYQKLQRQTEWRHPSTSRIGARPARQFAGPGDDSITLQGLLVPELCGTIVSLDNLRVMADSGKAWPLVAGTGEVHGLWTILALAETRSLFFADGAARRVEFTLSLIRVDDDRVDLIGTLDLGSSAGAIA